MGTFTSDDPYLALAMNVVFYLSALLSFACAASAILFGIVYRNDSLVKSVLAIAVGAAILFGVAWGLDELNWATPREVSLAAVLVVGPAWLTFGIGMISLLILELSRSMKKGG